MNRLVSFFFAFVASAHALRAAALVVEANKDASIYAATPSNSNGAGAGLFAGTDGNARASRALIAFDLTAIPAGSIITDVQLTLTLGQVAGGSGASGSPTSATIGLFDLTRAWGEGTTGGTADAVGIGGTGQGFPAAPGDATWSSASYLAVPWTTAGGDHLAAASGSLFLDNATLGTAFTWLSTPHMVADVQAWLDNPASNFGWELINADEVAARTAFIFYSRDWSNFAGGDVSQEPALRVTYTVPEPAFSAFLAPAVLLFLWRRRPGIIRAVGAAGDGQKAQEAEEHRLVHDV